MLMPLCGFFMEEQYLPSSVIDRGSIRTWQAGGGTSAFDRAKTRLQKLLGDYRPPELAPEKEKELTRMVASLAARAGLDRLPVLNR